MPLSRRNLRENGRVWLSLSLVYALAVSCTPTTTVAVPTASVKSEKSGSHLERDTDKQDNDDLMPAPGEDGLNSNEDEPQELGSEEPKTETKDDIPMMDPKTEPTMEDPKTDPEPKPEEPKEELVVANGKYTIRSVHSQRCLDIPNASKDTGVGLEIFDCGSEPRPAQIFELKHVGNKMYQITLVASGKSLEVRGQLLEATKLIQQATYVGGKYQQFEFVPKEDGSYLIRCNGANLVFDVQGAKVDNKTPIQIWTPNNFVNEQWTLTPVP